MPHGSPKAGSRQHIERIIQFIIDVQAALGDDEVRKHLEAPSVLSGGAQYWSLPVLLGKLNRRDLSVQFRELKALDKHYLKKADNRNSLFNIEFIKVLRNWLALYKESHNTREDLLQGLQSLQTEAAQLPAAHSSEEELSQEAASTSTASEDSCESMADSMEEVSTASQEGEEDFVAFPVGYDTEDSPDRFDVFLSAVGFEQALGARAAATGDEDLAVTTAGFEDAGSPGARSHALGFFSPSTSPEGLVRVPLTPEPEADAPLVRLGSYTGSRKCLETLNKSHPCPAVALLAHIQFHICTTPWSTGCFGGEQVEFADSRHFSRRVPRHVACQLDVMQAFVRDARNQDAATCEHLAKQALIQVLFDVPREAREKTGFCDMRWLNRFLFRSDETRTYYRTCAKGSVSELLQLFSLEQGTSVAALLQTLVSEHRDAPVLGLTSGTIHS